VIRTSCLKRGVLVGVGGIYGNVVRIQPPLVISKQQIDSVLAVITEAVEVAENTQVAV
jgi:diaminobutyrate-2-oxoglutarate transaminase